MSGKDIAIKVNPYRQILGSNLCDDIRLKIMAPDISVTSNILPSRKKISVQPPVREVSVHEVYYVNPSSFINDAHFAEISSWIDRHLSKYDIKKISYMFTCDIFRKLCGNIPSTAVIIKVNGTNEILGEYNPLVWTSNNQFK